MPIVLLESGGVAPRPPGLGACKSHKSTIGIAKVSGVIRPQSCNSLVIQAPVLVVSDSPAGELG
jgi:hypothetical protein